MHKKGELWKALKYIISLFLNGWYGICCCTKRECHKINIVKRHHLHLFHVQF